MLQFGGEEARENITAWISGRGRVLRRPANRKQRGAMHCAWPEWLLRLLLMMVLGVVGCLLEAAVLWENERL